MSMEWNDQLAYANDIISSSSLYPDYGSDLEVISERDYSPHHYFHKHILCLDMDTYEKVNTKGNADKTVDAVIGIRSYNGHELLKPRMLLVELRMNYKSPNNLSVASLIGKVNHTLNILGKAEKIDEHYLFVFTDSIYELTKRWFYSKTIENQNLKNYCPCSVTMVNNRILDPAEYPYKPYTNIRALKDGLEKKLVQSTKDDFLVMMDHWLKVAKSKYFKEHLEYEAISLPLSEIWKKYRSLGCDNEDEELEAEILEEDYGTILVK